MGEEDPSMVHLCSLSISNKSLNTSLRASSFGHGLECAVEFRHYHVIPLQVLRRRLEKREFEPTDQVCDREIDFHISKTKKERSR